MTSGYCRLTITEDTFAVEALVNKFDLLTSVCFVQSDNYISNLSRYSHVLNELSTRKASTRQKVKSKEERSKKKNKNIL